MVFLKKIYATLTKSHLISKVFELIKKYEELVKYCMIGVTGVTLDLIVFYVLTELIGLHYQYANFISVSCGITNNFFLNAYLNFKLTSKLFKRFISFYSIGLLGWLISAILLHVLVEEAGLKEMFAKTITIFVITVVQFTLNKTITFRRSKKDIK